MAGLTKETTSRILSRFKKERIISGSGKQLIILDLPRLQQMAPHAFS
jgi:CRP-like cAMP-binding protein